MCTPKTKIEREVDRLHRQLPPISERQKAWALKQCDVSKARKYNNRNCDIEFLVFATTKSGWQVLRGYYVYAYYRYKKLAEVVYLEVMQEWFKHGEYVFYSRNRAPGYCVDAWTCQQMSIKRGTMGGYILSDPRNLMYDALCVVSRTKQFSYAPIPTIDIRAAYRAMNAVPYAETILKQNERLLGWCFNTDYVNGRYILSSANEERITATRVAIRHRYDGIMQAEWRDLVDMLIREDKDIHNPYYVCPADLHAAHDELLRKIRAKEERARREEERVRQLKQLARDREAADAYPKARNQFFGVLIKGRGLQIKCLQSIEEFAEEGKAMHHCVFDCSYYDMKKHPNSLIMSARTAEGERAETIEIDIRDYSIVQCQGKCNHNSPYHDDILQLVNDNMHLIKEANKRKAI